MKSAKRIETLVAAMERETAPLTSIFDPDASPEQLGECLEQHHPRISSIRLMLNQRAPQLREATRLAVLFARRYGITTLARMESLMAMIPRGVLPVYMDLCAESGVDKIQLKRGNLGADVVPRELVVLADNRNLDVQFETEGLSPESRAAGRSVQDLLDEAVTWLDAGAVGLAVDAEIRDNGSPASLPEEGAIDTSYAELMARTFGLHSVMFRAPTEKAQQTLLSCLGEETLVCDVPIARVDGVEQLRRSVSRLLQKKHFD